LVCQFLAHEAVSIEPLVRAEPLRHRIKLPAAFVDRCARTRSIGVDVLARQRLNTNLIKDCRIVLDGHGPAWLADRNSSRFAATALNLMRNVLICSSRACCSAPGGSLRAVSKSLAAIFSRSCILSPLHFALQNTTDLGKRCLFGIGLKASSASAPCGGRDRPAHLKPADQTRTSDLPRVVQGRGASVLR
jgi:hypothetical protein